jgi:hypothetical protein
VWTYLLLAQLFQFGDQGVLFGLLRCDSIEECSIFLAIGDGIDQTLKLGFEQRQFSLNSYASAELGLIACSMLGQGFFYCDIQHLLSQNVLNRFQAK